MLEKLRHRPLLDQHAMLHDHGAVGKAAHQMQIVGNQQQRHTRLALQIAQQLQHLHAQRHIQRRRRLIGQQQLGARCQRHGDHGALALAAAELVRIALRAALRLWNARGGEQLHGLRPGLLATQRLLELQHFRHLRTHGHQRVERGHGLLKIMAISPPRTPRISRSVSASRSRPSNRA